MKEWGKPGEGKPDRFLIAEGYVWAGLLALGAIAAVAALAIPAFAHPGGLAADGCHMDRSAGVRHCHGGGNDGPPPAPRRDGGEVYYPNCAAARAAGAAPVRVGQPGYGRHLDRDGDGVGCE